MTLDQRRQKTGSNFSTSSSSRAPLGHPPAGTRQAPPSPTPYPQPAFCQHLPASSPRGQHLRRKAKGPASEQERGRKEKNPTTPSPAAEGPPKFLSRRERGLTTGPRRQLPPEAAACPESKKWTAAGAGRGPSARPGGGSAPSLRRRLASPPRRPPPACGGPARMGAGVSTYGSAAGGEEGEGCSLF